MKLRNTTNCDKCCKGKRISELDEKVDIQGTEYIPYQEGDDNGKFSLGSLKDYLIKLIEEYLINNGIIRQDWVQSEPAYKLLATLPELIADRACKDEFGNNINDTYLTREAVKEYIGTIYEDLFVNNPPQILDGFITVDMLSDAVLQLLNSGGAITNFPDDEDITVKDGKLKFKDKVYDPNNYSGIGRTILRKNMVDGVNVLTQEMMSEPNVIYVIQYDYDLRGETIVVPDNSILWYLGGSLNNGHITSDDEDRLIIWGNLNGDIEIDIDVSLVGAPADEEDITTESGVLKFKDKEYDTASFSGLGRKYLRKNIGNGKNILTQDMVNSSNTIYIIQYDYDLNGQTITVPEGCVLEFKGGSLSNGSLSFSGTLLEGLIKFDNIIPNGVLYNDYIDITWFGAKGDLSVDISSILNNLNGILGNSDKESCKSLYIPSGEYRCDSGVVFINDINIYGDGFDSILNFENKPAGIEDIEIDGSEGEDLPSLQNDVFRGDTTITFSSSPNLVVGDVFSIHDPRTGSFLPSRDYYKEGEFLTVQEINGNTVTVTDNIYGNYAVENNIIIKKINFVTASIKDLYIKSNSSLEIGELPIKVNYGRHCLIQHIKARGSSHGHIGYYNCFQSNINNCFIDYESKVTGLNYGIIIASCQSIVVSNCNLKTTRHAITTGASNSDYGIVNRDILIEGCVLDNYGHVNSADFHGNIEFGTYKNCIINNGVHIAGKNVSVIGCDIKGRTSLHYIYASDIHTPNINICDNTIYTENFLIRPTTVSLNIINISTNQHLQSGNGIINISNNNIKVDNVYGYNTFDTILIFNDSELTVERLNITNNSIIIPYQEDADISKFGIRVRNNFNYLTIRNNILTGGILVGRNSSNIASIKNIDISNNNINKALRGIDINATIFDICSIKNNSIENSWYNGIYLDSQNIENNGKLMVIGNLVKDNATTDNPSIGNYFKRNVSVIRHPFALIYDNICISTGVNPNLMNEMGLINCALIKLGKNYFYPDNINAIYTSGSIIERLDSSYINEDGTLTSKVVII